jgi:hypothetical protein
MRAVILIVGSFLLFLFIVGCTQRPEQLQRSSGEQRPEQLLAQQQWDGFTAIGSRPTGVGWCVFGTFKGQNAAILLVPSGQTYLVKRQYLNTQDCALPTIKIPLGEST